MISGGRKEHRCRIWVLEDIGLNGKTYSFSQWSNHNVENYFASCFKHFQPGNTHFQNLPVELSTLLCSEITNLGPTNLVSGNSQKLEGGENAIKFTGKDVHSI